MNLIAWFMGNNANNSLCPTLSIVEISLIKAITKPNINNIVMITINK